MKLTAADVEAIRAARAGGEKLILLARRYHVSEPYISLIAAGRRPLAKSTVKPCSLPPVPPGV